MAVLHKKQSGCLCRGSQNAVETAMPERPEGGGTALNFDASSLCKCCACQYEYAAAGGFQALVAFLLHATQERRFCAPRTAAFLGTARVICSIRRRGPRVAGESEVSRVRGQILGVDGDLARIREAAPVYSLVNNGDVGYCCCSRTRSRNRARARARAS